MLYFFGQNEQLTRIAPVSAVKEAVSTEQLNAPFILAALVDSLLQEDDHYIGHKDVINPNRLRLYKIIEADDTPRGSEYTGVESAYDDLQADGYIKDQRPQNKAVRDAAIDILSGSRWQIGVVHTSQIVSTNFYYVSRLEALQKLMELSGCEWQPRLEFDGRVVTGRYIDIFDQVGVDRGKRYEQGAGLIQVVKEDKRTELYTALIGRGKGEEAFDEDGNLTGGYGRRISFKDVSWSKAAGDPVDKPVGQEYVEIPEYTTAFGYPDGKPRIGFYDLRDEEDPAALLQKTYERVLQVGRPQILFGAHVRDQGDTGLGDTVAIIHKQRNIRYKVRIIKRTVDLLKRSYVDIELGDQPKHYVASRLSELKQQISAQEEEYQSAYRQLAAQLTEFYWGEDGYTYDLKAGNEYGLPGGMYSFDAPIDQDPTKVVYVGAGKILIANSKNPDGSWNFRSFLDGDGLAANTVTGENIVAESITTNHITAEGINADVIRLVDETPLGLAISDLRAGQVALEQHVNESMLNTFYDLPFTPYKVGDIWQQPEVMADYWPNKDMTGQQIIDLNFDGLDMIGGNSYIATVERSTGPFRRSDWARTGSTSQDARDEIVVHRTLIDALGIKLTTQIGDVTTDITDIKAGQAVFVRYTDIDRPSATVIDGGNIKTKTIDADKIAANAITSEKIEAGAITANKIAAGAITADMIQTGRLESVNGNSYFDLLTGFVKAGSGEFSGRITQGDNTSSILLGNVVDPALGTLKGLHFFDHRYSTSNLIGSITASGGNTMSMVIESGLRSRDHSPRMVMTSTATEGYFALRTGNCALQMTNNIGWDLQSLNGNGFGTNTSDNAPVVFINGAEYKIKVTGDGILRYE